jgi:hypothetical protein
METIHIDFISNPQVNEQCAGKAGGQSDNVYGGVKLVAAEIAKSYEEVISNHTCFFLDRD